MSTATTTDLDGYLARIGVAPAPTDLTLRSVVAGHTRAIAFENLDPFTGREYRRFALNGFWPSPTAIKAPISLRKID